MLSAPPKYPLYKLLFRILYSSVEERGSGLRGWGHGEGGRDVVMESGSRDLFPAVYSQLLPVQVREDAQVPTPRMGFLSPQDGELRLPIFLHEQE